MDTESKIIGSGYNPADELPKLGRKAMNSDQEVSFILFIYSIINFITLDHDESSRRDEGTIKNQRFGSSTKIL